MPRADFYTISFNLLNNPGGGATMNPHFTDEAIEVLRDYLQKRNSLEMVNEDLNAADRPRGQCF